MKNPSPNKHVMQGVPLTTCFVLLVLACLQLPVSERRGVPHHLIDVLDVHEDYSAGRFHDEAWAVIRDVVAVRPAGLQKRDTGNRTIVSCLVGTAASPEHMDSLLRHTTMLCILAQGKCLLYELRKWVSLASNVSNHCPPYSAGAPPSWWAAPASTCASCKRGSPKPAKPRPRLRQP
eukprot:1150687-Pelagomonas_calceolata.AAC.2